MAAQKRKATLADERGFTLVELLVVLVILGVLVLLGYTAMGQYHDRAANAAAKASLRQAIPAAEAYFSDNQTYAGLTNAELATYDSAISPTLSVVSADTSSYCLTQTVRSRPWSIVGPGTSTSDYVANATCS